MKKVELATPKNGIVEVNVKAVDENGYVTVEQIQDDVCLYCEKESTINASNEIIPLDSSKELCGELTKLGFPVEANKFVSLCGHCVEKLMIVEHI